MYQRSTRKIPIKYQESTVKGLGKCQGFTEKKIQRICWERTGKVDRKYQENVKKAPRKY